MVRAITIVVVLVATGLFAWGVPLTRLFDAFQPMIVALSIMTAAVFVRLNRGMPPLEWKSIETDERTTLTTRIVELAIEYGRIIAVNGVGLVGLITLSAVGKTDAALWSEWAQRLAASAVGAVGTLCVARMAYVIWRDIDIVRLQKRLIDSAAVRELREEEGRLAADKVADIQAAGVQTVSVPPPKALGE